MCGIIGFTGSKPAKDIIIDGLEQLEYRGYDSAGLALLHDGKITVKKRTGKVAELRKLCEEDDNPATCGIGHTRWATHGGVTELQNVHTVGLEVFQAGMQVVPERAGVAGRGLGGQDELPPPAAQGEADLFLAVCVGPGGVKKVNAVVQRLLEQIGGPIPGDTLNGQRAKTVFVDVEPGAAQRNSCHKNPPAFLVCLNSRQAWS